MILQNRSTIGEEARSSLVTLVSERALALRGEIEARKKNLLNSKTMGAI